MAVTPDIKPEIAHCGYGFSEPCRPTTCQYPCTFKERVLAAAKSAKCNGCWLIDGNHPTYMAGTFYPDLRGITCTNQDTVCGVRDLISLREKSVQMIDTQPKVSGNGNSKRKRIPF